MSNLVAGGGALDASRSVKEHTEPGDDEALDASGDA
jgi:hypothetical protein